jgi:hypothetical protein
MAEHSMQWKLFHEMDESVLQSTNVPTIPKTTSTTRYSDLRLPLTQHGLRVCYASAALWRNRPLLAQIATSGLLIQLELNPLDNPHTPPLIDTRPLCLVAHTRYNYLRQTVQTRLLASFSRTSSQSRREGGHSHS